MKNTQPPNEVTHDNMPQAVAKVYDQLSIVTIKLDELTQKFEPRKPNEYITRGDLADMLKVDLSTLHNWVKRGKLTPHCIGNRVYFLRAEIEAAIIPLGKKQSAHND